MSVEQCSSLAEADATRPALSGAPMAPLRSAGISRWLGPAIRGNLPMWSLADVRQRVEYVGAFVVQQERTPPALVFTRRHPPAVPQDETGTA